MGSKRQKNKNIAKKCELRQVRGGTPCNGIFSSSYLYPCVKLRRLCFSLRSIQQDYSFYLGHVLLGFTKCGQYLLSYYKQLVEDSWSFPGGLVYKYTLHWWRFNLMKPLQQVCQVSLFMGEVINEELLLIVYHTLIDNRIIVHGYECLGEDKQCKQCYVTICGLPPRTMTPSEENTWAVHMKYYLLTPFPSFMPLTQLKLQNTVVLNTVDSILAITVTPCTGHKTSVPCRTHQSSEESAGLKCGKPENKCVKTSLIVDSEVRLLDKCTEKAPVSASEMDREFSQDETTYTNLLTKDNKQLPNDFDCYEEVNCKAMKSTKCTDASSTGYCEASFLSFRDKKTVSIEETTTNKDKMFPKVVEVSKSGDCSNAASIKCWKASAGNNNCDRSVLTKSMYKNEEIINDTIGSNDDDSVVHCDESASKSFHFSSYRLKTFSLGAGIAENASTDDASYDINIYASTINGEPYELVECLQDSHQTMKDHAFPAIHTRTVSFDVEMYINETLNSSDELRGKYWSLRNYSTLVADVCEGSQNVVMHIVILVSVQNNDEASRRRTCSLSLLLSWSIATGETHTLDMSPLIDTFEKNEKSILKSGRQKVSELCRKYCLRVSESSHAVQVMSNHTVFTNESLQIVKHPSQPISIVL